MVALNTIPKNSVVGIFTATTKPKILHITNAVYLFFPFDSCSKQALFSYTILPKYSYGITQCPLWDTRQTFMNRVFDVIIKKLIRKNLTLNLPTTTTVAQPFNVIKWQLYFNPVA